MAYYDGELIKENFAKILNQVDVVMITTANASVLLSLSIYDTPKADVAEVKHGKWMKHGNEKKCSECQFIYYSNNDEWNFCPNCGAKMYE